MAKEIKEESRAAQTRGEAAATYTAKELIDGYAAFGCGKECVAAALSQAGVTRMTIDDAKVIVDQFMRKVIK